MSGVTVATMIRSISEPSSPASASASRAAGRQRSESACSGSAMRRSRIPVRSRIHSSFVSIIFERSSFVSTLSGTCEPMPGDRDRDAVGGPDHVCSTAKVSVPRAASWSPTRAVALPLPIGPRTTSSLHS